jgi:hypothetical protein
MPTPKRSGPHTEWFQHEIETMRHFCQTLSALEVANMLGRSVGAVTSQAKRLKVSFARDGTNTSFGRQAEEYVASVLPGSVLLTKDDYHAPYDIEWEGKRINVKASVLKFYKNANCYYWNFTKRQSADSCDYFLLLGFKNKNEKPVKAWLVPSNFYKSVHMRISHNSKNSMFEKFTFREAIV